MTWLSRIHREDLGRFYFVPREQALVVAIGRGQGRLVAEQHVEEPERGYVFAEDGEADGERNGQERGRPGAPEPRPEDGGDVENGHGDERPVLEP